MWALGSFHSMDEKSYDWLNKNSVSFSELVEYKSQEAINEFDKAYAPVFKCITELMDNTYSLFSHHVWMFQAPHIVNLPQNNTVIGAAIYKNFFVLYSALKLTKEGLYGPARTLLRHSYEFLMVAKFCGISHDDNVFKRWDSGDTVYFTNGILKKIESPDNYEFKFFWELLCTYSHATNSSQQISVDWNKK